MLDLAVFFPGGFDGLIDDIHRRVCFSAAGKTVQLILVYELTFRTVPTWLSEIPGDEERLNFAPIEFFQGVF